MRQSVPFVSILVLGCWLTSAPTETPANPLHTQVLVPAEGWSLKAWLAYLEKRSGTPIRLNAESLRAFGMEDIEETELDPVHRDTLLRLDTILEMLTARLWWGQTCVAYRVKGDGIELYARRLRWEFPFDVDAAPDPVYLAKLTVPTVELDNGIDENTPLKDAIEYLADRYEVRLILHERSFQALGQDKIEEMAVSLPPVADRSLDDVLKQVLDQVGAMRLVRADHVLIVPKLPALPANRRLARDQAELAWDGLASQDAVTLFAANRLLFADRAGAAAFFRERLRPVTALEDGVIQRLLADLDSNDFQVRDQASTRLELTGARVEAHLQSVLAEQPALEMRRRIEQILERRVQQQRRISQAVMLLEEMKTPEARKLLEQLADGAEKWAHLTWEARLAIGRLEDRSISTAPPSEPYRIEQPRHDGECPFPIRGQ